MRLRMKLSRQIPIDVDVEIGERSVTVMSLPIDAGLVFSDAGRSGPRLPVRVFISPAPRPLQTPATPA